MRPLPPAGAKNACRRGGVHIDGRRAKTTDEVREGQVVALLARCAPADAVLAGLQRDPRARPLAVVFEDAHVAVVIKPPGIKTQGSGDTRAEQSRHASIHLRVHMDAAVRRRRPG